MLHSFKICTLKCFQRSSDGSWAKLNGAGNDGRGYCSGRFLVKCHHRFKSRRRARVNNVGLRGHLQQVETVAPLSEMFGYSTNLRSITQGRATYTMKFSEYEPVSDEVQEKVIHGGLLKIDKRYFVII